MLDLFGLPGSLPEIRTAVCLAALLVAGEASAQTPVTDTLLVDIHTGPVGRPQDSFPTRLAADASTTWFVARTAAAGRELWRTDGTAAGTVPFGELASGPASSDPARGLLLPSGALLFAATADGVGREPHVVPVGASAATLLVDLWPGASGSDPSTPVPWQGEAWFVASDPTRGREFWRTDGTALGTLAADELVPGPDSLDIDDVRLHVAAGDQLFFVERDVIPELWVKPAPTLPAVSLTALAPDFDRTPWYAASVGGQLLFPRSTDIAAGDGTEPWITDGTVAGTQLLIDLTPGPDGTDVQILAADSGRVWLRADTPGEGAELWVTDGTAAGTQLVIDLVPGPGDSIPSGARGALLASGELVYPATDGADGFELWQSDGTAAGTRQVGDIAPGPDSSFPTNLLGDGSSRIWFQAGTVGEGREMWSYDALSGVTERATETSPGPESGSCVPLAVLQAGVVFAGRDPRAGLEPRLFDPGQRIEQLLVDIAADSNADAAPEGFLRHRNHVFFAARDADHGIEPWITDGTAAGTRRIADLVPGVGSSFPRPVASTPAGLLFTAVRGRAQLAELWRFDPETSAEPVRITGLSGTLAQGPVFGKVRLGDRLLFAALSPSYLVDLWVTDGTESGTARLPGWTELVDVQPRVASGGRAFGTARRFSSDTELLVSDGTATGTQQFDLYPGVQGSSPTDFAAVSGGVVFTAADPVHGRELWFAGGEPLRTERLTDLAPGVAGIEVVEIVSLGDTAVFTRRDEATGDVTFWRTDGTAAGTTQFQTSLPAGVAGTVRGLTVTADGSGAYFWADSGSASSTELWSTDGTMAGTVLVVPAPASLPAGFDGSPLQVIGDGRDVVFLQRDPMLGRELWSSDGTELGTRPLTDSAAGLADGSPGALTRLAATVLFAADDGRTGIELHALPMAAVGAPVARTFGAGCGAEIATHGAPVAGGQIVLAATTDPGASVALLFGEDAVYTELAAGCLLHLGRPLTVGSAAADPLGSVSWTLSIPADPALVGGLLHYQAFAQVPGGPLNGVVAGTPGVEIVIGR